MLPLPFCFFFFNDTATTEIYTLSLHDALPIWDKRRRWADDVPTGAGASPREAGEGRRLSPASRGLAPEIGRAHVLTPVTSASRMPSSAFKNKSSGCAK